jgi:hypothetical protein
MPTERPGRTLTQLLAELVEESRLLAENPAHRRARCTNCHAIVYTDRVRDTFYGPKWDTATLCGYCRSEKAHADYDVWPDKESLER